MAEKYLSNDERSQQHVLENMLIPEITISLPHNQKVDCFIDAVLSQGLENNQYRFVRDGIKIRLERVTMQNAQAHEPTPKEFENMQREDVLSLQDVHDRLIRSIEQYCIEKGIPVPPAPTLPTYTVQPAQYKHPAHIEETRARLAELTDWDSLREIPLSQWRTEPMEAHMENMQRFYHRYFNTEDGAFHRWLKSLEPALNDTIHGIQKAA